MDNKLEPLVSISCITYNHAPYIRQCLDGFMMQKTKFPFEILIHDDCSTDGTTEIIKEYEKKYPDIIKPIYEEENQYQNGKPSGSMVWNFPRAKGKYIALCEGDDYWIDPFKLQKQVDFLESHPEFGMCYTDFNLLDQKNNILYENIFRNYPDKYPKTYNTPEDCVLRNGYVAPPTWLMLRNILPSELIPTNDSTFVLFTHFLCNTKVSCLCDTTATYRVLEESAAHSKSYEKIYNRNKTLLDVKYNLIKHYNLSTDLMQRCTIKYYSTNFKQFVINNKHEDVKNAKKVLKDLSIINQIFYIIDYLHLNKFIKILYKIIIKFKSKQCLPI